MVRQATLYQRRCSSLVIVLALAFGLTGISFAGNNKIKEFRDVGDVTIRKGALELAVLSNIDYTLEQRSPNTTLLTISLIVNGLSNGKAVMKEKDGKPEGPWLSFVLRDKEGNELSRVENLWALTWLCQTITPITHGPVHIDLSQENFDKVEMIELRYTGEFDESECQLAEPAVDDTVG